MVDPVELNEGLSLRFDGFKPGPPLRSFRLTSSIIHPRRYYPLAGNHWLRTIHKACRIVQVYSLRGSYGSFSANLGNGHDFPGIEVLVGFPYRKWLIPSS